MTSTQAPNSRSSAPVIGLTRIWEESQDVGRVSGRALIEHIFRRVFENMVLSPVTAALTVLTITIALLLVGFFALLMENSRSAVTMERSELTLTLFLKDTTTSEQAEKLMAGVKARSEVAAVSLHSKAQALEEFRMILKDDAAILEGLEAENPLPASIEVTLRGERSGEGQFEELRRLYSEDPRVEVVRYSRGALAQLGRILSIVEWSGMVGMVFLLIITGFIISNTISLALYSHRTEVEIMRLVGASPRAIQAPYIIEGAFQGLCGALFSLVLLLGVFIAIRGALVDSDLLRFIFPEIQFLSVPHTLLIVCAGILVGTTGSYLAVRKFLAEE